MPLDIHPEHKKAANEPQFKPLVLAWWIWASVIVALILWGFATSARAEEIPVHVFEKSGVTIRLMSGPCVDQISLAMIRAGLPKYAERFKAIDSEWAMQNGTRQKFAGCWAELTAAEAGGMEDVFILVFEDGQGGSVTKAEFLKKPGPGV